LNVQLTIYNALLGTALILGVALIVQKVWEWNDATTAQRLKQEQLNEELAEMNDLLKINANLVEASVVMEQGKRFQDASFGLAGSGGLSIREMSQRQTRASRDFWANAQNAETLARAGGLPDLARKLGVELNMMVSAGFLGAVPEEDVRKFILNLMADLSRHGGELIDKAREMGEAVGDALTPPTEWDDALNGLVKKLRKLREEAEKLARATTLDAYTRLGPVLDEEIIQVAEKMKALIQDYLDSGDPLQLKAAFKLVPDLEGLKEPVKDLSQAFETILRQGLKRAADGVADALAGKGGFSQAFVGAFSSVLDEAGTFLIQFGVAFLPLAELFKSIRNFTLTTGQAWAVIAAGVAIKAVARGMASSFGGGGGGGSGGSSSTSSAPSSLSYPSFTPNQWSMSSGNNYNIYALDAKSFEDYLAQGDVEPVFGRATARVARSDKETGGSRYGIQLAPAR